MRKFLHVLVYAFLFAATDPSVAHAGFVVAAIGAVVGAIGSIGAAIGGLGIAGVLIKAAIGIAINYGISLLTRARTEEQVQPGVQTGVQVGGDNPRSFIMGYYSTAGQLEYANTGGEDGKTPNAYLNYVLSLSDLPISSLGTRIWVNGEARTIDTAFGEIPDTPSPGYRIVETPDHMWVKFYDGTQTTVSDYMLAHYGSDPVRPWSSSMVFRGVAYLILTTRFNREVFSGPPQPRFELYGIPLYDIRKDSTNGGSGTHRWNDQSTWEYSDNPVVMIYNIMRGVYYDGEWMYGGQNWEAFRLPAANWIAAANACDTLIDLAGGGTEKQYRAGIEIRCDVAPLDAIQELLKACNGRIAEIGGVYKIQVNLPGATVYSFTDADLVVTTEQTLDPFPGLEDTNNGVAATYPEPLEAWESKDAPPRYSAALETEDQDRRLLVDASFPAVPYPIQVQRLMQAMILEERRFRTHLLTLPPDAWVLEPNDMVSWTSDRNGYSSKKFIVTAIDGQPGMNQTVHLKEVDPADYDWDENTDQVAYDIAPLGSVVPGPQAMTGWQVEPATYYDASTQARRPTMQVSYDGDLDDVRAVRIQVREDWGSNVVVFDGEIPYSNDGVSTQSVKLNGTFLPNQNYEVRGKFLPYSGRETDWSAWLEVTTPNVGLKTEDISDEAITKIKFAQGLTPVEIVATLPVTGNYEGRTVVLTTDHKLYRYNAVAGQFIATTAAADITGAVTSSQIADAAISAAKLASSAVTNTKIAAGAIFGDKIAANSITTRELVLTDFTNLINDPYFATNAFPGVSGSWTRVDDPGNGYNGEDDYLECTAVGTTGIALDLRLPCTPGDQFRMVGAMQRVGSVTSTACRIYVSFLTTSNTTTGSVVFATWTQADSTSYTVKSADSIVAPADAVSVRFLVYNAAPHVGSGSIRCGFVGAYRRANAELIVDGSIIASKIGANAVVAGKIDADAITAATIATGAVTADAVAANAIGANEISANAITAVKISAGSITTEKMIAGAVSSAFMSAGSGIVSSGGTVVMSTTLFGSEPGSIRLLSIRIGLNNTEPNGTSVPITITSQVNEDGGVIASFPQFRWPYLSGSDQRYDESTAWFWVQTSGGNGAYQMLAQATHSPNCNYQYMVLEVKR